MPSGLYHMIATDRMRACEGAFLSQVRKESGRHVLPWLLLATLLGPLSPHCEAAGPGVGLNLAWDANTEPDLAGYRVYFGFKPGHYARRIDVGNTTKSRITLPLPARDYFIAVTAYDLEDLESSFSKEVTYSTPASEIPITTLFRTASVPEDSNVDLDLSLDTTTPAEGTATDWLVSEEPQRGRIESVEGVARYVPDPDFAGTETLEIVTALDSEAPVRMVWEIEVLPVNDPPSAPDLIFATGVNAPITVELVGDDIDNSELTFQLLTRPRSGSLSGAPPALLYTPALGYRGTDEFLYRAFDGATTSFVAKVHIDVGLDDADALVRDQFLVVKKNTPRPISLDYLDVPNLSLRITRYPEFGTLEGFPPELIYQPAPGYAGPDSFAVEATEPLGRNDIAIVALTVDPLNDPPMVEPVLFETPFNTPLEIQLFGTDAEGDPLIFEIVDEPLKGSLSGEPPQLTFTPRPGETGVDTFAYRAFDGTDFSTPATGTIRIGENPTPPPTIQAGVTELGLVRLHWNTIPGLRYQVLFRERFEQPEWVPVSEPITALSDSIDWSSGTLTRLNTGFYAIRVLPP